MFSAPEDCALEGIASAPSVIFVIVTRLLSRAGLEGDTAEKYMLVNSVVGCGERRGKLTQQW